MEIIIILITIAFFVMGGYFLAIFNSYLVTKHLPTMAFILYILYFCCWLFIWNLIIPLLVQGAVG